MLQGRVRTLEGSLAKAERTIQQQQEMLDKQSEIMEYGARMDAIQETLQTIGSENETRDKNADDLRTDHDSLKQRVVDDAAADKKYKDGLKVHHAAAAVTALSAHSHHNPQPEWQDADLCQSCNGGCRGDALGPGHGGTAQGDQAPG